MKFRVLGSSGGIGGKENRTSSFLVDTRILIDAGTGLGDLTLEEMRLIDHVLISHTHLDHIALLPLLIDSTLDSRYSPLKVYATQCVVDLLREHIFNWSIWPDFSLIPTIESPFMQFVVVEEGIPFTIGDIAFTAMPAEHTVPAAAFQIDTGNYSLVYSGDTYLNDRFWATVNQIENLKGLIVECAFPNEESNLAFASKHLYPERIAEQLPSLKRPCQIFINHLKPSKYTETMLQLLAAVTPHPPIILQTDDVIDLDQAICISKKPAINEINLTTDLFHRLNQLNEIGSLLSAERDIEALLEKILIAAKNITHADGGTIYRYNPETQSLAFKIVRTDSLGIAFGGTTGKPLPAVFKDVPLYLEGGRPNTGMIAAYAALHKRTINIPDAYNIRDFDFSGTRAFDRSTGYHSHSFLTIPMCNHENEVIGVLQLLNAIEPATGEVRSFSGSEQKLCESLASQAAIALTNRMLTQQMEDLFEAFIKMINTAIDEKSPYTGEHCQRVPALTMMIAEAMHDADKGPLAEIHLTDNDYYELKIAALLHDCGKITTPIHIVDKATKLQTIFDRIELIDTRFEVIKRDLQIAYLDAKLACIQSEDSDTRIRELDEKLANQLADIAADRAFLRHANMGREKMDESDLERVLVISRKYTWIGPDNTASDFLTPDETNNLRVPNGTLLPEEREIINQHINTTIQMLETLPWPNHLKQVPALAGAHHERMDGKGYPKGLKKEEISVLARSLGIADIFEALTSRDRPYKRPMPVSQAMQVLQKFSENGHIDPDIYNLFREKKIYRRYAETFLEPGQNDLQ